MNIQKKVKVIDVVKDFDKEKRDGGTYQCTLFAYEEGGEIRTIALANAFLKSQPKLTKQLDAVKAGDAVDIRLEKSGMYWNLKSVVPESDFKTDKEATKATVHKVQNTYNSGAIGMQVGNALTNAATLLAHGKAKGTLEEVAEYVLRVGETLKVKLEAGEYAHTKKEEKKPEHKTVDVFEDEEIPFGD